MNAALLMMSCCLAQGGEKPPPPPPPPVTTAPPVALHSAPAVGCGNCAPGICAGTADPMPAESKSGGLFSKLKSRLGGRKKGGDCDGCGATYVAHAAPCDGCGDSGRAGGLLSRLKARLGGKKKCAGPYAHGGCGCDAGCGGCGVSGYGVPGTIVPTTPAGEGPKQMEKPKDPKSAGTFPYGPVTPVAGPAIPPPLPLATAKSPF